MLAAGLFIWFRYYYTYLIVTNLKLIEIEQKGLFNRNTSTLELIRVEDVKGLVRGVLATFLRYGDVLVETAGATESNFLFEKIPNASYVSTQVLKLSVGSHKPELTGRMAKNVGSQDARPQNTYPQEQKNPADSKEKLIMADRPVRDLADQSTKSQKDEVHPNLNQSGLKMSEQMKEQEVNQKPEIPKEGDDKSIKGGVLFERDKKDKYKSSGSDKINKD